MTVQLRLERRLEQRWWHAALTPVLAVLAAFAVGAVFLAVEGFNPITVYRALFEASFTSTFGITDSLAIATPLVVTGLAAGVAFRMNLFNIGAEGQLYAGAIAGSWAGFALGPSLPGPLAIAAVLVASVLGGVLWALPMAVFKARFGTSEIITSLMLTFVALYLMRYLIFGSRSYWRDPAVTNFPQGKKIDPSAELPLFGSYRTGWGLVIVIAVAVAVWVLIRFTRPGYDMNVVGSSPAAAAYAGISALRVTLFALLLSGGLGGLAGGVEVASRAHALDPNGLELGLGFTGIVVAALARYNPFGIIAVAVFLGGLRNAGVALQSLPGDRVPVEVSLMLQGAILLFAIGAEIFVRNRLRVVRSAAVAT
ncbi:MAG: ABC transporter permease [Acidimicrobiia bacterium]|nr:ABC transporter permease [Acidimicrobiia bacterium]